MSMDYHEALKLLSDNVCPVETQETDLAGSFGRILGDDIKADENVPSFDRSPYDGYAFMADDTKDASPEHTVTLKVIENIRAGQMPKTGSEKRDSDTAYDRSARTGRSGCCLQI